jgi:hypothetical protein
MTNENQLKTDEASTDELSSDKVDFNIDDSNVFALNGEYSQNIIGSAN